MIDKKDCDCAETGTYKVLDVVNIIQIVLLVLVLIEVFVRVGKLGQSKPTKVRR